MLLSRPAVALVLLVVVPTACGGEPSGAAPRGSATPTPAVSARPASSVASAGEPCGIEVSRSCAGDLTCVRSDEGATCQALPRGVVCGAFQCAPDEACCDRSRSECTKPGAECAPRPPVE